MHKTTRPARISVHISQTSAVAARYNALRGQPCGYAFIYVDGACVVQTRAATDSEALREARRQFRLTRADRRSV